MTSYNGNPNPYASGSGNENANGSGNANANAAGSGNSYGSSNPYSGSYGQNPYAQSQQTAGAAGGANPYPGNPYGQNPYQQSPYQSAPNAYQQNPYQQAPYAQSPYQQPYQTYPMSGKSKIAAGLLGLFLGSFGVHNFYLGNTGKAVAQLLLTLVGWIIVIGPFVAGVWGLIEGIMILCSQYGSPWHRDANGYELRD